MAGHSKWANIKHKKERADAKKGKAFSKVTKEIITAVKQGGSDPKTNAKLRLAILKAKEVNLPNENIERNIKKAEASDVQYETITYELYGYGGVGIICEAMTDNKNRTYSDIRIATNKRGGVIANPGAVSYQFDQKGILQIPKSGIDPDLLLLEVLEKGGEDFQDEEEAYFIITAPDQLYQVKEGLEKAGYKAAEANIEMIPKMLVACDEEAKKNNEALIEWLEGIDDVDEVYHNMEM
ncbi:MAG: YebC/PmpR family DNA-binding transcriptional regulator [Chlamydiae bacterium]|jgi:YebC/PmpR family DNA-binding regulatory protein|nr:YebC/PmpR family DNA-binding transcriptional regulator [Chlamydiota bacterium]